MGIKSWYHFKTFVIISRYAYKISVAHPYPTVGHVPLGYFLGVDN